MTPSLRTAFGLFLALLVGFSSPIGAYQDNTNTAPKVRVAPRQRATVKPIKVAPKVVTTAPTTKRTDGSGHRTPVTKAPKGDWQSGGGSTDTAKPPKTRKPPKADTSTGDGSSGSGKPPKTRKPPKYEPPATGGDDVSSGTAKPPKGNKPPKGDKNPPSSGGDDVPSSPPPSGDKGDDVGSQNPPKGTRPPRNPKNPKNPKNPPTTDPNSGGDDVGTQEPDHNNDGGHPPRDPRPPRRPPIVVTIDPFHPSQDDEDEAKDEKKDKKEKKPKKEKEPKDEPETVEPAVDQVQRFAYSTTRCRALAAAMLQAGRIDAAIWLIELLKEQESLEWAGRYSDGTLAGAKTENSDLAVLGSLQHELAFWKLSDVRRASTVESLESGQKKSKKAKKPKSDDEDAADDQSAADDDEARDEKKSKDEKSKDEEKGKDKKKDKDQGKSGSVSWVTELEQLGDRILVREQEASILRAMPAANRSTLQSERLATLESELAALANDVDVLMARVASNSTSKDPRVKRLRASDGLPLTLSRLGPGVAALYTLIADERCWIVLITPNGKTAYSTPIQAAKLNALAMSFRETLTNPKLDPLPLAGQLYDILIKPVAAELTATRTTTLLWSFDGVMRYVPVAALHDGQGYVVEKYQNVLFTRESLERLLDEPSTNVTGIGFGVASKIGNFNALPAVAEELRGIFTDDRAAAEGGVIPGRVSIDASFTEAAFEQALQDGYGVVHIATHFQLEPTKAEDSVLLLGDGTLMNVGDIRDIKRAFKGTDLLTLSACNTASSSTRGDGKEVESFATIAQDRGARAVIASLWSVNDRSTSALMQTFYRLRAGRGVNKAEALRKAQEMLLRGSLVMPSGPDPDRMLVHEDPKPTSIHGKFTPDPRAPFAHPYYWAPFTLVGNYK